MHTIRWGGFSILGALLLAAVGCGTDAADSEEDGTGGTATGTGGVATGTGGETTGTGGVATGTGGVATGTGGVATGTGGETTGTGGVAAGTGGAGSGDPACDTYCNGPNGVYQFCGSTLATANPFTSEADCVTKCNAQTSWDLACRQNHLGLAGSDKPFHCPHTIGTNGQCADTP